MDNQFFKEITPNLFRITQGADHFIFRIFGAFFLLPGLFVTALALGFVPMDEPPPPLWGPGAAILFMGFFFAAMGLWLMLRRYIIEVDMRKRQIIMTKAAFPWSKNQNILAFDDVATIEIHAEPDGRTTWYTINVRNKNEWPFQIFSSLRLTHTTGVAAALAQRTRLPVMDFTTSNPQSLSLAELQVPLEKDVEDDLGEPISIDDARFREIRSRDASVRLLHCEYRGVIAYKAIYPKPYAQRLFICAFALFINYQFTGFNYGELYAELQQPDRIVFYSLFFGVLILLTVVFPLLGLLKTLLTPPHHAMIQIRGDEVSIFDMGSGLNRDKRRYIDTEVRREDIIAVSATTAEPGTWKIAKTMNCLQLRTRTAVLQCFYGMNADHLEIVKTALLKFVQRN